MWRSSIRSNSDPDMRNAFKASNRPGANKPLKTCLKQKAKSANATPPNEPVVDLTHSLEYQKLRRMKTVDFEEVISKPMPSRRRAPNAAVEQYQNKLKEASKRTTLCPGTAMLTRRLPACPAVTRTDVHVIAITPALSNPTGMNSTQPGKAEEVDPTTPTMQIVESNNGSYEVIWDDVPSEYSTKTRKLSSSAGQALEAINSTATKGLERVNMKLTEWSGTWNIPSDFFKPAIVVFPDDDGRRPHFECAIMDDEDMEIFAPPNSEKVSVSHSRQTSLPVTAQMSRAASQDGSCAVTFPRGTSCDDTAFSTEQGLLVLDPDAWSDHLVAGHQKLGAPNSERKLSNMEEADVKFRNHRDSVAIAHSHLIHFGGVRPELFTRRDSITMAKKRMQAGTHKQRTGSKSEPGPLVDDRGAATVPLLPIVKAHAAEALKRNPATILRRLSDTADPQHIRIKD